MIYFEYHRQDAGQSAAIQEGWDNTSGDIVAWLNADDYYFPNALVKIEEIFLSKPDIDVVYSHAIHISAEGDFMTYFPAISKDIFLITRGCIICQPSCFVRRSAMERVGGLNSNLHYTMDWDFWLRLYHAKCSFYFLDELTSVVRIYPETKTLSGAKLRYQEIERILRANTNWFRTQISLMGFHYYDLTIVRTNFLDYITYSLLSALKYIHRTVRPKSSAIKGIECWTNFVKDTCEIQLPWWHQKYPCERIVLIDRPIELSLIFANESITAQNYETPQTVFLGKKADGYLYKIDLPKCKDQLLSFILQSNDGPWCLLSLKVL